MSLTFLTSFDTVHVTRFLVNHDAHNNNDNRRGALTLPPAHHVQRTHELRGTKECDNDSSSVDKPAADGRRQGRGLTSAVGASRRRQPLLGSVDEMAGLVGDDKMEGRTNAPGHLFNDERYMRTCQCCKEGAPGTARHSGWDGGIPLKKYDDAERSTKRRRRRGRPRSWMIPATLWRTRYGRNHHRRDILRPNGERKERLRSPCEPRRTSTQGATRRKRSEPPVPGGTTFLRSVVISHDRSATAGR